MTNVLLTTDRRRKIQVDISRECRFCHEDDESTICLFKYCRLVAELWSKAGMDLRRTTNSLQDWVEHIFNTITQEELWRFISILWSIWKECNKVIWNNKTFNPSHVISIGAPMLQVGERPKAYQQCHIEGWNREPNG
ncbi:unnamed protein product [Cuscuta epithymum]|uniref:Reverse transcriptase zinc-binding domain-containing protein n=1 Tax=Cuscuta epithymum TaxID=186058 RepID=A0AAV0D8J1_9ASTE|nr:unnamed protein product [Cuscuta epithymum]